MSRAFDRWSRDGRFPFLIASHWRFIARFSVRTNVWFRRRRSRPKLLARRWPWWGIWRRRNTHSLIKEHVNLIIWQCVSRDLCGAIIIKSEPSTIVTAIGKVVSRRESVSSMHNSCRKVVTDMLFSVDGFENKIIHRKSDVRCQFTSFRTLACKHTKSFNMQAKYLRKLHKERLFCAFSLTFFALKLFQLCDFCEVFYTVWNEEVLA